MPSSTDPAVLGDGDHRLGVAAAGAVGHQVAGAVGGRGLAGGSQARDGGENEKGRCKSGRYGKAHRFHRY